MSNKTNPDAEDLPETTDKEHRNRASLIKNKLRRQLYYRKEKLRKAKEKRERKENRKRKAEQLGEEVRNFGQKIRFLHRT